MRFTASSDEQIADARALRALVPRD